MRIMRHLLRQRLPLIGMGLMLAGLCGAPAPAAGVEPFTSPSEWGAQYPDEEQTPWGPYDDRGPRVSLLTGTFPPPMERSSGMRRQAHLPTHQDPQAPARLGL
jgi:hypothetical protein